MLQYQVDTLEGLDAVHAGFYAKDGDKFRLKIEGLEIPDVAGLKAKNEELLAEAKAAKKAAKDAADAIREAAALQAAKDGDVEAVKKSLRDLFEPQLEAERAKVTQAREQLNRLLVKDQALKMAAELAVDTDAIPTLAALLEPGLMVVEKDGEFITGVRGTDGKPSGLTVEEYRKQKEQDKSLARLLKASDATGGGAKGSKGGGAAAKSVKRGVFDAMSDMGRMEYVKSGGTVTD